MEKQLYIGDRKPQKEFMTPVQDTGFIKGSGGLWTSSYIDNSSDWLRWCNAEDFYTSDSMDGWLLTVNSKAKILTIDSIDDYRKIFKTYGYKIHGIMNVLKYEEIAKDYDGLNLTHRGQSETRYNLDTNMYGWDVESTHWFKWVFDEVKYVGNMRGD